VQWHQYAKQLIFDEIKEFGLPPRLSFSGRFSLPLKIKNQNEK